jgi:hypothetical protein
VLRLKKGDGGGRVLAAVHKARVLSICIFNLFRGLRFLFAFCFSISVIQSQGNEPIRAAHIEQVTCDVGRMMFVT